jgi:hypothetical protein|tara:strand:+ start:887 stop:1063 length:177 start_codon:yes stop_codon:yes gene_type:complete
MRREQARKELIEKFNKEYSINQEEPLDSIPNEVALSMRKTHLEIINSVLGPQEKGDEE